MTAQDNKELIRHIMEDGFNKKDIAVLYETFYPDYMRHGHGVGSMGSLEEHVADIKARHEAFDDARFDIGDRADLFDNTGHVHARIRITDVYTCRFDAIPEKLWSAEAEPSAQAFRDSHVKGWPDLTLTNDAMLTAIHFERLV